MKPEVYFLKYAYPCTYTLLEQGKISEEKQEFLKQCILDKEEISREELEFIFPNASKQIKKIASKLNLKTWSVDVIKQYFTEDHNMHLDYGTANVCKPGETFKEFCKVRIVKVIKKQENILTIQYQDKTKKVLGELVPNVQIGNVVTIHQGFAVEIIHDK